MNLMMAGLVEGSYTRRGVKRHKRENVVELYGAEYCSGTEVLWGPRGSSKSYRNCHSQSHASTDESWIVRPLWSRSVSGKAKTGLNEIIRRSDTTKTPYASSASLEATDFVDF